MCWNKEISLNTFIFSSCSLLFLYYVNTYTKYKSTIYFNGSIYKYLFVLSFSMMQLLEYFIWKSIENNDKKMNYLCSILGFMLVHIQPIASMMLLPKYLFSYLIPIYIFITSVYYSLRYFFYPIKFQTTLGEGKHLAWNWLENKGYWEIYIFIWLFFIAYTNKNFLLPLLSVITFFYTYIKFRKSNEWGSIWCWSINFLCLYFLFDVLIVSPYKKNEC
jgi:hypothetical protein